MRQSALAHWDLEDLLGGHFPSFREAIDAAEILRVVNVQVLVELRELLAAANWARHTAPLGGPETPPRPPPGGIRAAVLEHFREKLRSQVGDVDAAAPPPAACGPCGVSAGMEGEESAPHFDASATEPPSLSRAGVLHPASPLEDRAGVPSSGGPV